MSLQDEYNKSVKVINEANKVTAEIQRSSQTRRMSSEESDTIAKVTAERRKAVADVVAMDRQAARDGQRFDAKGGKYELKDVGPKKEEAQREYCRRFNNERRTGPDQKTDRERVAARVGIRCPA